MQQTIFSKTAFKQFRTTFILLATISTCFTQVSAQNDLEKQFISDLDAAMLSAYEGNSDAQFNVGVLFASDEYQAADHEQAAYWYKQAARQGHQLAQYNLGHQYMTGLGVIKSEKLAMDWWLKAAKNGHILAQFNIGRGYYLGIGLEEDHKKSRYWFEQAASQEEPKSIHILKKLGWTENLVESVTSQDAQLPDSNEPITSKIQAIKSDETISENNVKMSDIQTAQNTSEVKTTSKNSENSTQNTQQEVSAESESNDDTSIKTNNTTDADQEIKEESTNLPVAVYTNPRINSVLIAIVDHMSTLDITKRDEEWSSVTSVQGFPVWVHSDFLSVDGKQATLTGSAVNARSVPIISSGTIVGRLNKGETVGILNEQKGWYRVTSPARFVAWAKTKELQKHPKYLDSDTNKLATQEQERREREKESAEALDVLSKISEKSTGTGNDNEWLFTQPSENYTLQLASFGTAEAVRKFTSRNTFLNNPDLHRFISINDNTNDWTYFLYGSYKTREKAEASKKEVGQKNAWIRQFKQLRQNRCVIWKQQLPPPKELNKYCR